MISMVIGHCRKMSKRQEIKMYSGLFDYTSNYPTCLGTQSCPMATKLGGPRIFTQPYDLNTIRQIAQDIPFHNLSAVNMLVRRSKYIATAFHHFGQSQCKELIVLYHINYD